MLSVRTRFAPSPTGFLHVGGIRTALFAWLVARQAGGQFILRIEDTDQARAVPGSVEHIQESIRWLGLKWDEGPDSDGPHGPYFQSQRLDIYKKYARQLIEKGLAYADPYTPEEVQTLRDQAKAAKQPFLYRNHRPPDPPVWDGSQPLRFKSTPRNWNSQDETANAEEGLRPDLVMGDLHGSPETQDDFILIKSDGFPTYNFAHIIDDHEMEISHVIRGQEFLASMPNYLNLYAALGFRIPQFATLPHILGPDGKKKLSKRDGAKDILDYREQGIMPEAMLNFLASMGWNDGSDQEVFTVAALLDKFRLDRVQRSGARFDEQRLLWLNGTHIRQLPLDDLYLKVSNYWPAEASAYDDQYKLRVLGLVQERLKYFGELPALTRFFFTDLPLDGSLITNHKQLKKFSSNELKTWLTQARESLEASDFSSDDLTDRLNQLLAETGLKPAVLFSLLRIATTQAPASPGLAETLSVLGKPTTLRRIDQQLSAF